MKNIQLIRLNITTDEIGWDITGMYACKHRLSMSIPNKVWNKDNNGYGNEKGKPMKNQNHIPPSRRVPTMVDIGARGLVTLFDDGLLLKEDLPRTNDSMITANLSKDMAQKLPFAIEGETWLISIRDRNKEAIVPDKIFKNVLFVDFNDINGNILKHNPEEQSNGITDKEAEAIADFILEAKQKEVNLFVNCNMGMCRSGGVVKILLCLHWQLMEDVKLPDMFPNNEVRYAIQKFVVQKLRPNAN